MKNQCSSFFGMYFIFLRGKNTFIFAYQETKNWQKRLIWPYFCLEYPTKGVLYPAGLSSICKFKLEAVFLQLEIQKKVKMPLILKIQRDWSLLHFEIRRDRSPHKILKIWRDWSLPSGEIGVPIQMSIIARSTKDRLTQ